MTDKTHPIIRSSKTLLTSFKHAFQKMLRASVWSYINPKYKLFVLIETVLRQKKGLGITDHWAAQTPWVLYHSSVLLVQSTWLGSVSVLMRSRCHCPPGGTSQNHWSSAHCSLPQGSCEQPDLCKISRHTVIPPHKHCNTYILSSQSWLWLDNSHLQTKSSIGKLV